MDVHLSPEQEDFVRQAVEGGRFHSAEDAVREALVLLERREQDLAELRAEIADGLADLEAGRFTDYGEETLSQLADDIRRDAMELRVRRTG